MTTAPFGPFSQRTWRIGFGTYQLAAAETEQLVTQAIRGGWRHFDTAKLYQNEAAVGAAVRNSGVRRSELFVTTKIHVADIRKLCIKEALECALQHLDEIDLVLLHGWHSRAPEAWAMLTEQLKMGRVRAIGVSNFGISDLSQLPLPAPTVNQIEMSPFLQRRKLRAAMTQSAIATAAHSPLVKARCLDVVHSVLLETTSSSKSRRMRAHSPAQVLLAWSIARGAVPIVRTRNAQHMRDNLAALAIELDSSQLARLDDLENGLATHPDILRD